MNIKLLQILSSGPDIAIYVQSEVLGLHWRALTEY